MKKVLLTVIAMLGVTVFVPAAVVAANPAVSEITGIVSNSGNPVKGAKVSVSCNGHTGKDTTDKSGSYRVQFSAKKCPAGSSVTVSAMTKSGLNGIGSGVVNSDGSVKLNVAIVNVSVALPEMGLVTGSAAVLTAGGAFLVIRRRNLANIA